MKPLNRSATHISSTGPELSPSSASGGVTYSLLPFFWEIDGHLLEYFMLAVDESLDLNELSLPQFFAAFDFENWRFDTGTDVLRRGELFCRGITDPHSQIKSPAVPCVITRDAQPRGIMHVTTDSTTAAMLKGSDTWTLRDLLFLIYQLAFTPNGHASENPLFDNGVLFKRLSWNSTPRDVIESHLPSQIRALLTDKPIEEVQHTGFGFYINTLFGLFGFQLGEQVELIMFDVCPA